MNLIPTRVVDKNGRATTVHKRSGSAIAAPTKLSTVKPVLKSAKKTSAPKVDTPFEFNAYASFGGTRLGHYLNSKYPERAMEVSGPSDSYIPVTVTTREVYRLARHGFTVRSAIHLAHYGVTEAEALDIAEKLKRAGHAKELPVSRPNKWMDVMLEADIDHKTLLAAYENGLTTYDLDEMPPSNAADTIRAYTYKGFSRTRLAERVAKGAIAWEDIKSIGVTRVVKNEWVIMEALERAKSWEGEHEVTLPVIGEIIRDIEAKPRTRLENGRDSPVDQNLYGNVSVYRVLGDDLFNMHMPETALEMRRIGLKDQEMAESALYCDEVIHKVRSNEKIAEAIISANGGRRYTSKRGSYKGQYEDGNDPVWNFITLASYKKAGVSVDQCVDALVKGMSPERAASAIESGIASPVTDGWL